MIMLSPLLILLLSILIKKITDEPVKNKSILVYVIVAIFLIYPIIILPISGEIVTLIDAKNSVSYGTRTSAMDIATSSWKFLRKRENIHDNRFCTTKYHNAGKWHPSNEFLRGNRSSQFKSSITTIRTG